MIGNAMLGEYEQYSHAPSSKLVYNLHTLVFLGIVRRQGSCKTLTSKHPQTLSFSGTFPVKISLCIRRSHYRGSSWGAAALLESQGLYHLLARGFTAPETGWEHEVCAHSSSQPSRQ